MITPAYSATATERVLPRLALDFTTGVLDSRVTVTRALNTATRINSSGLVEGVNANLPRFDYDPVTLAPKGLLIEETRANLCLSSGNVANLANWNGDTSGGSVPIATGNYATAPDGTMTATRLQIDRGAGTFSRWRQGIATTSAVYTDSIWMRTTSGTGTANVGLRAAANGVNCVVTGQWQRFQISTGSATTNPDIQILSFTSIPGTDVSADILVWGGQVEAGAFATSYIPTTTTSLTRNFDQVKMTGANFSSWYNASEGTFTGVISDFSNTWAGGYVAGNNTDHIGVYRNGTTGAATNVVKTSSSFQALLASGTWVNNTQLTFANSYKANAFAFSSYANVPATDAAGTVPTVSELQLGYTYGVAQLNGHIVKFNYYPQALTLNEVRAFSK